MIQSLESAVDGSTSIYIASIVEQGKRPGPNGRTIGYSGMNGMLRLDPAGYILSVFVEEKARGRGIGSSLINRACQLCAERGCETIGLSVSDNNPRARQLYRRLGFVKYVEGHEGYTQFIKTLMPIGAPPAEPWQAVFPDQAAYDASVENVAARIASGEVKPIEQAEDGEYVEDGELFVWVERNEIDNFKKANTAAEPLDSAPAAPLEGKAAAEPAEAKEVGRG